MNKRKSGILLHISSLPCEFGIGDLGPSAYHFVDFLHKTKQHCWQVLPLNPTDSISEHSPYSSSSAFAGNILFISPELLVDEGVLEKDDVVGETEFLSEIVDYDAVSTFKTHLYRLAYDRYISNPVIHKSLEKGFNEFAIENSFWLDDYALFVSIKDQFHGNIWTSWPEPLRKREEKVLNDFKQLHEKNIQRIKFLQFLFFKQWKVLQNYCEKKGISLIGDMSIYVNLDSADVWAYPQNYKLDDQFNPQGVAGVPPDYFSSTGQRWGNPVYDWARLEDTQFSWWVERLRHNFKLFDTVRIDHFRGLVQYWEIPANEQKADIGRWVEVPTDSLFKTLEREFSKPLPIIAEDLGYITNDVREVMCRFSFPGMKVLLFAFNGEMNDHPYLPHNYIERCVVYTGTHDNNTVLGWYKDEATQRELDHVQQYLDKTVSEDSICYDLIHMALDSVAEMAIIPMQDVCGLGSQSRMNKPATMERNWRWRAGTGMFSAPVIQKLLNITIDTKRN